jgi:hypothetical protein
MTESNTIKRTPMVELFLTIKSWFLFLLSKWWIILIFGILGGLLGILVAYTSKPDYESRLTFALDEGGTSSMSGAASLAAQFGLNIGGTGNDVFGGDNILEIMKSRRNIETVLLSVDSSAEKPTTMIDEFLTITNWKKSIINNDRLSNISFPAGITKSGLSYLQDSILYINYESIITTFLNASHPDKRLNIYEVNVTSPNERFTKIFTDKLVSNTNAFYTEIRTKKSRETLDILEERANLTKGMLSSSITDRAVTQDANINPAVASAQVPLQKQQFNIQVYGGAYGELYKNLEFARFQYLKDVPLMQIIDAADYPMKKIKLGKTKAAIIGGLLAGVLIIMALAFIKFIKQVK